MPVNETSTIFQYLSANPVLIYVAVAMIIFVTIVLIILFVFKKLVEITILYGTDVIIRVIPTIIKWVITGKISEQEFEGVLFGVAYYDSVLPRNFWLGVAGLVLWFLILFSILWRVSKKYILSRRELTLKYKLINFVIAFVLTCLFMLGFGLGLKNTLAMISVYLPKVTPLISISISEQIIIETIRAVILLATGIVILLVVKFLPKRHDEGLESMKLYLEILKKAGIPFKVRKITESTENIVGEIFVTSKGIFEVIPKTIPKEEVGKSH